MYDSTFRIIESNSHGNTSKYVNTVGLFKSFVMNNKAFYNLFCNPQKSFHTSTILQLAVKVFVNAIVEFVEWLTASVII